VNTDEEEQQRRCGDEEEGHGRVGVSRAGRCGKGRVCGQWQQRIKQPIIANGLIGGLAAQSAGHDDRVDNSKEAQQPPEDCDRCQAIPGSGCNGGEE
jgi:hypothetical protein